MFSIFELKKASCWCIVGQIKPFDRPGVSIVLASSRLGGGGAIASLAPPVATHDTLMTSFTPDDLDSHLVLRFPCSLRRLFFSANYACTLRYVMLL